MNIGSALLLAYLVIGGVIAGLVLLANAQLKKMGHPDREADLALEHFGRAFIVAGIVLFWPALAVIVARKGRK